MSANLKKVLQHLLNDNLQLKMDAIAQRESSMWKTLEARAEHFNWPADGLESQRDKSLKKFESEREALMKNHNKIQQLIELS